MKKQEREQEIFNLLADGKSASEVSRLLGISRQRVEQILRPGKLKARRQLFDAVKAGHVERESCEFPECESKARSHAHHDDYNKPLEVIWLCPNHHSRLHVENSGSIGDNSLLTYVYNSDTIMRKGKLMPKYDIKKATEAFKLVRENNLSIRKAAKAMNIHPNQVTRYIQYKEREQAL